MVFIAVPYQEVEKGGYVVNIHYTKISYIQGRPSMVS